MEFEEKTLSSKQIYDGKIVKVFKDDIEISDGHKTFREVVRHSGGVVILAVKAAKQLGSYAAKLDNYKTSQAQQTDKNHSTLQPFNLSTDIGLPSYPLTFQPSILFVRQFRYPIGQTLLELPAGKLEYGEDPFLAAKRELEEETGYCANKWTDLGYVYTSPGYSDEKLYLYLAEDLEYTHSHPDEGEILEPLEISYEDALRMIKSSEITDAKTLCAFMKAGLL